jgi:hypothetical protein
VLFRSNHRGFLDFLNAFNFTVHEDSPEDHTVAVDPEMLGHIFENLLEDNKSESYFVGMITVDELSIIIVSAKKMGDLLLF